MFGRILMTLGLAILLASPAHAGFGLVLPDSPIVDDPEKTSLNLVICAIDPATGAGIPIERPQVFTALRYSGDNMDRSEHLSVLDEVVAYGARAWTTNISLPHPGVYQLVMQTKAGWVPEQDKFVQYVTKVQIPAYGSAEGWDKPANISFEISPLSRPFGLCSGMAFSGQALFDGTPIPGRSSTWPASIRRSSPTLPSRKIPTRRRRTTRPSPRPKSRISSPRRSPFPPSAPRSRSKPTARASSRSSVRSPAGGLSRPAWPAIPSKIPKASRNRWKSRPFSGST
ncbi:MAG: DUF4198 domain-containing protein [Bilophila wadsworthia]